LSSFTGVVRWRRESIFLIACYGRQREVVLVEARIERRANVEDKPLTGVLKLDTRATNLRSPAMDARPALGDDVALRRGTERHAPLIPSSWLALNTKGLKEPRDGGARRPSGIPA